VNSGGKWKSVEPKKGEEKRQEGKRGWSIRKRVRKKGREDREKKHKVALVLGQKKLEWQGRGGGEKGIVDKEREKMEKVGARTRQRKGRLWGTQTGKKGGESEKRKQLTRNDDKWRGRVSLRATKCRCKKQVEEKIEGFHFIPKKGKVKKPTQRTFCESNKENSHYQEKPRNDDEVDREAIGSYEKK